MFRSILSLKYHFAIHSLAFYFHLDIWSEDARSIWRVRSIAFSLFTLCIKIIFVKPPMAYLMFESCFSVKCFIKSFLDSVSKSFCVMLNIISFVWQDGHSYKKELSLRVVPWRWRNKWVYQEFKVFTKQSKENTLSRSSLTLSSFRLVESSKESITMYKERVKSATYYWTFCLSD